MCESVRASERARVALWDTAELFAVCFIRQTAGLCVKLL